MVRAVYELVQARDVKNETLAEPEVDVAQSCYASGANVTAVLMRRLEKSR